MIQPFQSGKGGKSSLQYKSETDCGYFLFSDLEIPKRIMKSAEELSCPTLGHMTFRMFPCDKPVFPTS